MRKEIIKTDNYLLLVSDEEIKKDEYYVSWEDYYSPPKHVLYVLSSGLNGDNPKKVIGHLPLNPLSAFSYLESVPLLPEIEEDDFPLPQFEYDAMDAYIKERHNQDRCMGFIDGYNKAKEVYKYTEEDLEDALRILYKAVIKGYSPKHDVYFQEMGAIIQSLQQPKYPIAFEIACDCQECSANKHGLSLDMMCENKTAVITNSQGKKELVGTYIWK